jgi:hypothetical protein
MGHPKISGLNLALDALGWLPMPVLTAYATVEHATLSRLKPDACYFLLVEVIKCPNDS